MKIEFDDMYMFPDEAAHLLGDWCLTGPNSRQYDCPFHLECDLFCEAAILVDGVHFSKENGCPCDQFGVEKATELAHKMLDEVKYHYW